MFSLTTVEHLVYVQFKYSKTSCSCSVLATVESVCICSVLTTVETSCLCLDLSTAEPFVYFQFNYSRSPVYVQF